MVTLRKRQADFQLPPLPPAFHCLDTPSRYKTFYGGRGGAKSWSFARKLIERAHKRKQLILCTRLMQTSIKDSAHRLIKNQIVAMGLADFFKITDNSIRHLVTGSEFIFKGLHHHPEEIKSLEGVDIVWIMEAQNVGKESWEVLRPTIRKDASEIWMEFNTGTEDDYTYKEFVINAPPNAIVRKVNYDENPHFPQVLEDERKYALAVIDKARDDSERAQAQADYDNIWEGFPRKQHLSAIFQSRVYLEDFDTPKDTVFYHGADWGFANDPTCIVRCFIRPQPNKKEWLYIDYEAYGYGTELDNIPQLFEKIPTARKWRIEADSSRPDTINHVKRKGFDIYGAEKGPGSVEDGITFLKGFERIIIHSRCPKMREEAKLYSYKVDKKTEVILPDIIDAWNHGWDSIRYALWKIIKAKPQGFFD